MINIIILVEHLIESEQDFVLLGKNFQHIMSVLMFPEFYFLVTPFYDIKTEQTKQLSKTVDDERQIHIYL